MTTLSAGDIAITAFQSDDTGGGFNGDAVEFVLLKSVTAGTTIYFTDGGYQTNSGTWTTSETVVRWVAQSDLPTGTVITFTSGATSTAEWTGINPSTGATLTTATLSLDSSGDSITAIFDPTFGGNGALSGTAITCLYYGASVFPGSYTGGAKAHTGLPAGLTDGVNAISIGPTDNGRYDDTLTGTIEMGTDSQVRGSIFTDTNWLTSNTPLSPHNTTATWRITTEFVDKFSGTTGDDVIDMLSGNDTFSGGDGNDTITGGNGADTLNGDAGNDVFIVDADDLVSGEKIDGGSGTDTLRFDGATGSLSGVTLTSIEEIALNNATGVTVTFTKAQAGLVTSAIGTSDKVILSDIVYLTKFDVPTVRNPSFTLIDQLLTNGVEQVQWVEDGGTNVATLTTAGNPANGVTVTSTDTTGQTWATRVLTLDASGNRLQQVTTHDDGMIATRDYVNDIITKSFVTNIVGDTDTITVLYDSLGRVDSHTAVFEDGSTRVRTYDDAGRLDTSTITNADGSSLQMIYDDSEIVDSRISTAANGVVSVTTYNDAGQRLSVTVTDASPSLNSWQSQTTLYDAATQIVTKKTVIYDDGTATVHGNANANVIEGRAGGDDRLYGLGGADVFVFSAGGGHDTVTDFQDGTDKLNLLTYGVDQVSDFAALGYTVTQQGAHLLIDFGGGDTLKINNMLLSNLGDNDLFSGS